MSVPALPPIPFVHGLLSWPRTSQEQARRNAMVATTACTQRRVERQDVEAYLASLDVPETRASAE